ncbi:MAG: hypothetical protein ABS79_06300 [Planctomycetes bacterium SCN 63-9]|nr:MAG: hypothetical protein ABS79_06300 [Planctomycetes bacterium SCN 63-9]
MDRHRRRFIPASDDLEARKLMATTTNVFGSPSNNNTADLAITYQQKQQRVENLPRYMLGLQPGRFLPKDLVGEIQDGLTKLEGQLHRPGTSVLNSFNLTLRKIVPNVSLSTGDARKLHQAFVQVLQAAGAPDDAVDKLSTSLNTLVTQVDTASIQPVFLATNDYTLVLQTALSIGKPLPAPQIPQIAKNTGTQVNPTLAVTGQSRPYYVGTYAKGTAIQLINTQGEVIGQTNTNNLGQYRLRVSTPLSPGTYTLYARAEDQGHLGLPSHTFQVKIVEPRSKS